MVRCIFAIMSGEVSTHRNSHRPRSRLGDFGNKCVRSRSDDVVANTPRHRQYAVDPRKAGPRGHVSVHGRALEHLLLPVERVIVDPVGLGEATVR